jgi:hypothetical protein
LRTPLKYLDTPVETVRDVIDWINSHLAETA